jgi:isopropylmalate/homocitrate/citramalate synthase
MPTPSRIPPETRQEAARAVAAVIPNALNEDVAVRAADAAIDAAWSKLLGDARDRVATLISAADAYLYVTDAGLEKRPAEDIAAKRRALKRALAMLEAQDAD